MMLMSDLSYLKIKALLPDYVDNLVQKEEKDRCIQKVVLVVRLGSVKVGLSLAYNKDVMRKGSVLLIVEI